MTDGPSNPIVDEAGATFTWHGPAPAPVVIGSWCNIEATAAPPIRLWLDVGSLEDLADQNDRLAAILARRGFDFEYRRYPGGHDQTSWAASLVDALPALFPPAVAGDR